MKSTFLSLLIIAFFALNGYSQEIRFGVNIDPQFSWLSPEARDVNKEGNLFHLNGGLIVENYFAENYALATGVQLGVQGGSMKFDNASTIKVYNSDTTISAGSVVDYKLQYISVPLNLKLKSNEIGYLTYYVLLGFVPQFNISAKGTSSDGALDNDNISKEISWFNLGYDFGGGVEYGLSEDTALTLGVIFSNGFLDITDNNNAKVMSRVLSIRVGIMF